MTEGQTKQKLPMGEYSCSDCGTEWRITDSGRSEESLLGIVCPVCWSQVSVSRKEGEG